MSGSRSRAHVHPTPEERALWRHQRHDWRIDRKVWRDRLMITLDTLDAAENNR